MKASTFTRLALMRLSPPRSSVKTSTYLTSSLFTRKLTPSSQGNQPNHLYSTNIHFLLLLRSAITREIRVGYIGFLTAFAKKLISLTSVPALNTLKESSTWTLYVEGKLK